MQYDPPLMYSTFQFTVLGLILEHTSTRLTQIMCSAAKVEYEATTKAATTVTGGARAATAMTTTMEPMRSIELNEVEEPEGDSNTRCWRVRWTRPNIAVRPKQAPYAKSSSSSEEAARANRRPRRKCEAPIIEQYAATRPQHEGSTTLYALLSYPCCSTTERPATENVAASPTAAISSRTQAGRSRDRGLDRKAGQLAITFAELHSTRRWAG